MLINHTTFSLKMKLNDVIGKDEKVILENIRRCKLFVGKTFKVIFRNDGLSEEECQDFVKRNEKMLFEIRTQITSKNSPFDSCWILIDTELKNKSKRRFKYEGNIITGIEEYIKMIKHLNKEAR